MGSIMAAMCQDARVDNNGRMSLIGIFHTVEASHFPCVHQRMFLGCSIPITPAIHLERWLIQVDLIDSDGKHLAQAVNDSRLMVGFQSEPSFFDFTAEVKNLTFPSPGDYQFSILINGTLVQTVDLHLKVASKLSSQNASA